MIIVVMGVSGSGKTTVGRLLADRLQADFVEGDDLHPPANVAKMASGVPLEDADRWEWLDAIAAAARTRRRAGAPVVVTCSALRRVYRERLADGMAERPRLVFLRGDFSLIDRRMQVRSGHFMPPALLRSQLDTLEEPDPDERALVIDIDRAPDSIAEAAWRALQAEHTDDFAGNSG